ncbi:MAG: thioesterase family protein, partial [Myxococcales bacterium]
RLRSLTAEIVGPVQVGPALIEVEMLRQGNAVSTLRAVLRQGGEVLAHAVAVLGAARPGAPGWQRLPPPPLSPWGEVEALPVDTSFAPVFTRHFEFRSVGPFPFMEASEPVASGWIRPRAPATRRDDAYLTALADAWWLAGAATFAGPRPFATIAFSLELLAPLDGLDPEVPLFHRAVAPAASEGYVSEYRELWGHDGRLLALNHQVMVVIK